MKKSGPNEIRDVCRAAGLAGLIFLAGGCANGRTGKQILPADPDVARFARAGRAAFEAGSSEKAADLYQEALQKAEALDDTQVSAYLALNIAAAQFQAGRLEAAERAAQTASDLAARAGTGRAAAELLRARAAFASGALDRAESACAAAEAARPNRSERADLAVLRSEISAAQSDFPASDNWAREANRRMPGSAAPALRARLSARLGDLRLRENQAEKAAEEWEREASFWRDARYAPGVSDALLRAAEAWRQAGRMDAAAVDFLRAARSLAAQDRPEEAALAARQGLELSNEPGSPEVLRSLRELIP